MIMNSSLRALSQRNVVSEKFNVKENLNVLMQISFQLTNDSNLLQSKNLQNPNETLHEFFLTLIDYIAYLKSVEGVTVHEFLQVTASLVKLFKLFHEYEYFSLCWKSGLDLNSLIEQLFKLWERVQCYKTAKSVNSICCVKEINEVLNNISQLFGFVLLGNLDYVRSDLLRTIGQSLLNEINSRSVTVDGNVTESYHIYSTMSHLVFLHPICSQLNLQRAYKRLDNVFSQYLLRSFQQAFLTALKYVKQPLKPVGKDSGDDDVDLYRLTVQTCLIGLSQLQLRRLQKFPPNDITEHVKTLWSYVILLSGLSKKTSKQSNSALNDEANGCVSAHNSMPSSDSDSYQSVSPLGGDSSSSDCEGFIKRDMKPSAIIHNDSLDSALITTQNIANCLLHNNNNNNSSSSNSNNCRHPAVPSSTTTLSLSPSSPQSVSFEKLSTPHQFQRSSYKNTSSKKYASFISEKRSTVSPSNAYKSHSKCYLLAIFCLKHMLEMYGPQVIINCWPILMNSDCLQTTASEDKSFNWTASHGISKPDMLNLYFKTNDVRIKQILLEILVHLLSHVNKRFAVAEDLTPYSASFIPYSVKLAMELRHLHRRLVLALSVEKTYAFQALLLKALGALVLITPYQRLQPGLLTSLLPMINHLLQPVKLNVSRPADIRSGCLSLLGNILGKVNGPLIEVFQILSPALDFPYDNTVSPRNNLMKPTNLSPTNNSRSSYSYFSHTSTPCWLVQVCLRLIHPDIESIEWDTKATTITTTTTTTANEINNASFNNLENDTKSYETCIFHPLQVRKEALVTLHQFIPNYANFLQPSLPLIMKALIFCIQEKQEINALRTYSLRFLTTLLPYLTSCCYANNIPSQHFDENQSMPRTTTTTEPSINANLLLSEQMTNIHLTKADNIEDHSNQIVNTADCSKNNNNNNYNFHNNNNNTSNTITINSKLHIDEIQVISWWQTFLPFILNILQVS
ncbi:unnamed protein product [Trichobilharzia szidati]|nr:unnamed protein product [Trichobilharzia szidati]